MELDPSIITPARKAHHFEPRVVDLKDWRERYQVIRKQERDRDEGRPVVERQNPSKQTLAREAAIEDTLRDFGRQHGLNGCEIAASIACAIRRFRAGWSGASSVEAGKRRAKELAWGAVRCKPDGPEAA